MRSKDVIYISNAVTVEAEKAITFFRDVVGSVNDPITAANNFYALKSAVQGTSTTVFAVGTTP
jgi:hypothetical protein